MERFRKILKTCLERKFPLVEIRKKSCPILINGTTTSPIDDMSDLDDLFFETLINFLFPKEKSKISTNEITKGTLNIPNVGLIPLLFVPNNGGSIRLYMPPQGAALWEEDFIRFSSTQQASESEKTSKEPASSSQKNEVETKEEDEISKIPFKPNTEDNLEISQDKYGDDSLYGNKNDVPPSEEEDHPSSEEEPEPEHQEIEEEPPIPQSQYKPPLAKTKYYFGPILTGEEKPSGTEFFVDTLIREMVAKNSSDLHLTQGEPPIIRVDGDLQRLPNHPHLNAEQMEKFLLPILTEKTKAKFFETWDADFVYEHAEFGRFRVNVFRDKNGVGSVMRHIPSKIIPASTLRLPKAVLQLCDLAKGLILVTGPTGCGKSTTLASMIDLINTKKKGHILTIEDPIEFVHPQKSCLVNQREVSYHTQSFSRALQAALREDPDVVLIGEMRDLETIALAIETAESGHLVFGTMYTPSAVTTIDRIVDQFPPQEQEQIRISLSSSLKAVLSQILLKKTGGGRVGAYEVLISNDVVASLIREHKSHLLTNHMQTQKAEGNQLLNENLVQLIEEKTIEPIEAFLKTSNKKQLIEFMKRKKLNTSTLEERLEVKKAAA